MSEATENLAIKNYVENDIINQDNYNILFSSKDDWFTVDNEGNQDWAISRDKQNEFWEVIKKIKVEFENMPKDFKIPAIYDFSFIKFPKMDIHDSSIIAPTELLPEFSDKCLFSIFYKAVFYGDVNITNSQFNIDLDFRECMFKGDFRLIMCQTKGIDFSNAIFEKKTNIKKSIFKNGTKFNDATFHDVIRLEELHFEDRVNLSIRTGKESTFKSLIFEKIAYFGGALFSEKVTFNNCNFNNDTEFTETVFNKQVFFSKVYFYDVLFIETFFLSNVTFIFLKADYFTMRRPIVKNLKINNSFIKNSNLDRLFNTSRNQNKEQPVSLTKEHIADRQTARFLKDLYDNQKNIPNSNQLFAIEQDYFIDEINKKNILESNKLPTLTTLYLNKWVSNFGTDWIRALLFLFMISYLFMRLYIDFDTYLSTNENNIQHFTKSDDIRYVWAMFCAWFFLYLSTFFNTQQFKFWILIILGISTGVISMSIYDNVLEISNYMVQLTNPINSLKKVNLYEGIEIYGAIVRIVIVTVIYQLIVAFRQNTRRK